jgi:hypothetical protein
MDVDTVFGVKWPSETPAEIFFIFLFILILFIFLGLLKYYKNLQQKKINDQQLFLFKMKRLGLSNFQIKIINNMSQLLQLSKPNEILNNSKLFESALGKFLIFTKSTNESEESMESISKDISIIYGKLYHPAQYKKPMESLLDIENDQLLYFTTKDKNVYLGKIISKNIKSLTISLFRNAKNLSEISVETPIDVYIWRVGDAEYSFSTTTMNLTKNILAIKLPDKFLREREFRHPYITVILPCTISKLELGIIEEREEINGSLYKINDFEAVIRISKKLEYKMTYQIKFTLDEFNFLIDSKLISNKTMEEGNITYYTFKFQKMSDAAINVLKRYMYDHL